jgi:hypothetical protein
MLTCNRGDCPAKINVVIEVHGADFGFCRHHYTEFQGLAVPYTILSLARRDPGAATPHQVGGLRSLK